MKKITQLLFKVWLVSLLLTLSYACCDDPPPPCNCETPDYLNIESINPDFVTYEWPAVSGATDYTFSLSVERTDGTVDAVVSDQITTNTSFEADLTTIAPLMEDDVLEASVQANCSTNCVSGLRVNRTCWRATVVSVEEIYPIIGAFPEDICVGNFNCSTIRFIGKAFTVSDTARFNPQFSFYQRSAMCNCLNTAGNTFESCLIQTPKCYYTSSDTTGCQ